MAPDVKSLSWQRNDNVRNSPLHASTRRRLSDMFDKETKPKRAGANSPLREMRPQFSLNKLRMPRASPTRRALRSGADKLVKTFQQLRVTVGALSQRLRGPTRRRRRLENTDTPSATPQTRSRRLLGRTPTQLYSPFSFETPNSHPGRGHESPDTPNRSWFRSCHPRRSAPQPHQQPPEEPEAEQENERPLTRSFVQTRAMVCQPSPTCRNLLE